jgi:predicted helicase
MNKLIFNNYYREIDKITNYGKTKNESSLRIAFQKLLGIYANNAGYQLVPEINVSKSKKRPDGTIYNAVNDVIGFYESKDTDDNLDDEISAKFRIGYPNFNIVFEDSETIILFQDGTETKGKMKNPEELHGILEKFINYQTKELYDYIEAVEHFKKDLKNILDQLRSHVANQVKSNRDLKEKRKEFLLLCRESINKDIRVEDVDEMIIQHLLTNEIFSSVFDRTQYHIENNIAKLLNEVIETFFKEEERLKFKSKTDIYYNAIKAKASRITDHHEKQKFLKQVYEQFYKIYNPKLADKLGVVYTPNEIVNFIIKGTDYFISRFFNKTLNEENVEIIDPASGTGTFICDLIDYIPLRYIEKKYENELHANEIAILPYYVANLNIEATYHQKTDTYKRFNNIVLVDTLELISNNNIHQGKGKQKDIFGLSLENISRISNQNQRKISVVMGNPPYNANQISENDNNKNKNYSRIDSLGVDDKIKRTYIKLSRAQKTKAYDMYIRFFRWATDRIENDGIISFITNRSFLSKKSYDGFRLTVEKEFQYIYLIDLKGEMRGKKKDISNVFGITTGVAISFMVKRVKDRTLPCQIHYYDLDVNTKIEKLKFLETNNIVDIPFERIISDSKGNWLKKKETDFENLIPLGNKLTKAKKQENAIFRIYANGVVTNRDEWLFDFEINNLISKTKFLIEEYNKQQNKLKSDLLNHPGLRGYSKYYIDSIKWSEGLKNKFHRYELINFKNELIIDCEYRPFTRLKYYSEKKLSDRLTSFHYNFFGNTFSLDNMVITVSTGERAKFSVLATNKLPGLDFYLPNSAQCFPLYSYELNESTLKIERRDNITDWGLLKFQEYYKDDKISKTDIFYYTYAILHDPNYKDTYEDDLDSQLPSLPFYEDFYKWVNWGKELMDLHINYNDIEPYDLQFENIKAIKSKKATKIKIQKLENRIIIDENTAISNIPEECWNYYLGNRTALEWIVDQYQEVNYNEKHIDGKILNQKFNTYRVKNHKEDLLNLIAKICTVSVKTVNILDSMQLI